MDRVVRLQGIERHAGHTAGDDARIDRDLGASSKLCVAAAIAGEPNRYRAASIADASSRPVSATIRKGPQTT
jgi:hypothetical protein